MKVLPLPQPNHRNIDTAVLDWLDLHFPPDSSFHGRIFIGKRHETSNGLYDLTCRDIDELQEYVGAMHISQHLDYYITCNSFCGTQRNLNGLFAYHNIVIDIDNKALHKGEDAPWSEVGAFDALLWRCNRDLWETGDGPKPTSVVSTGRGLQFWWALEPISEKWVYSYDRLVSWLCEQIEGVIEQYPEELGCFEIDTTASKNRAGWRRLPCTFNSKTRKEFLTPAGKKAYTDPLMGSLQILHRGRKSLLELEKAYVPKEYRPKQKTGVKRAPKVSDWFDNDRDAAEVYVPLAAQDAAVMEGGTTGMALRVQQMCRLRGLRKPQEGEGRDKYCIIVYSALLSYLPPDEAWYRLMLFNSGFDDPFAPEELEQMMKTALKKRYKYSNEKIIEYMGLTKEEQDIIGLYAASGGKKEARTSNYTRDTIRKTKKNDRDNKVLAAYAAGGSKAQIARDLGLSRNTVNKIIAEAERPREAITEALEAYEQVAIGLQA